MNTVVTTSLQFVPVSVTHTHTHTRTCIAAVGVAGMYALLLSVSVKIYNASLFTSSSDLTAHCFCKIYTDINLHANKTYVQRMCLYLVCVGAHALSIQRFNHVSQSSNRSLRSPGMRMRSLTVTTKPVCLIIAKVKPRR